MTREDIEYTLRKSQWEQVGLSRNWRDRLSPPREINLGRKYIYFTGYFWPKAEYRTLTSKKWTELTGLKFHRRPK